MAKITQYRRARSAVATLPDPITDSMTINFDFSGVLVNLYDYEGAIQPLNINSIMLDIPQLRGINTLSQTSIQIELATYDGGGGYQTRQGQFFTYVPKMNWETPIDLIIPELQDPDGAPSRPKYNLFPSTVPVVIDGRDLDSALAGTDIELDIYLNVSYFTTIFP